MAKIRCFLLLFLMSWIGQISAQEDSLQLKNSRFNLFEWGLSLGYGFVNEQLPEGKYEPILLLGHLEIHAHRKKRKPTSPHYLLVFAEPQINPVLVNGAMSDWEGGVNLGLKYLLSIKEKNGLYFHAGSGPHYISVETPEHQANGFVFANNFGMGYQRKFKKEVQITFGYRFRHVSNLNINLPNLGLDNHFFTIGFKKDFPKRVQAKRKKKEAELLNSNKASDL